MSSDTSLLTLSAPAKVNLSLRVLGRRDDGFHTVETRMCPVSIADELTLEALPGASRLEFTCSDSTLPTDESNLVVKAVRAYEARVHEKRAWRIHLQKHVPSGAGLGGGSSDAAAVLRGMNQLSGSPLSVDELCEVAATIGSDVPFFIHGKVCDATGRGEQVVPVDFPHQLTLVLIKPPFGIPTPWAYKNWRTSEELTGVTYQVQSCPWGDMVNDLERPVFQKYLLLPSLKMWLLAQPGVAAALMSGSGSTMFAVVPDEASAQALAKKAQEWCGPTAWVQVVHTFTS